MKRFTLTVEHIALLRHANVRWDGVEWGGPCVDGKRPYGNGGMREDIARILGWELWDNGYGETHMTKEQDEEADRLHEETEIALAIVLATGSFQPGEYVASDFSRDWRPA